MLTQQSDTPSPKPSSASTLPVLSSACTSYPTTRSNASNHKGTRLTKPRGPIGAAFGASAGIFALFFFDGIPRVQTDILQKVPFLAPFYTNEVAPEDNPF